MKDSRYVLCLAIFLVATTALIAIIRSEAGKEWYETESFSQERTIIRLVRMVSGGISRAVCKMFGCKSSAQA